MLTPDVRFEGWTTEDWLRFLRLWQPRTTHGHERTKPRGGLVIVHEEGLVLKLLHTHHGRLDPSAATALSASGTPSDPAEARAVTPRANALSSLPQMAQVHHASWVLSLRLGALDEVMERFGARARRGDDFTAQSVMFLGIVREMIEEGAIATWPQRLRGLPLPTATVIRRTLDALCANGRAVVLGLFDEGALWTSFVARRRGDAFDVVAGPEELRPGLGLLSGDWRRDYRHLARAVEERYAPLGFGCFAELSTFRSLQTDSRPGAWSRAVAVRDVIISPMPVAVGVAIGFDGTHYALRGLRALTGRIAPLAVVTPWIRAARTHVARATGKDVTALLGFDPLAALRQLLDR
ncbi:MAG: hypothetical protein ABSF69_16675 [Polyangiaceae bacterium]